MIADRHPRQTVLSDQDARAGKPRGWNARGLARLMGTLALAVTTAGATAPSPVGTAQASDGPRDILWEIVSQCLNEDPGPDAAPDCERCPILLRTCCGTDRTPDRAVVWDRGPDFVAINDSRTCACPTQLRAGLALPRARVTGIEDPRRPEAIWPYAWNQARARFPGERDIALAINPPNTRTQDQMHIHLVRISPEVRQALDQSPAQAPAGTTDLIHLDDLQHVFETAARRGDIANRGILVTPRQGGGWWMLLTHQTSPEAYTVKECPLTGSAGARQQP